MGLFASADPSPHYWCVPIAALIDTSLTPQDLSNGVQYLLGDGAMTSDLIMSPTGVLYGGDLENRTVVAFDVVNRNGQSRLVQKTFVGKHPQLSWADGFALQNGYLYISDSHLHELDNFSNGYPCEGRFAIFCVRLPKQPAGKYAG